MYFTKTEILKKVTGGLLLFGSGSIRTWAEWRSQYSDWLRAGRSGDRIPVGARFSAPVQTGFWAHPASCTMDTGSFPGVKSGRRDADPSPFLVTWSRKSGAITLHILWAVRPVQSLSACTAAHFTFTYTSTPQIGRTACTEPQCL